ncbi:hypothetical protein [Aurantimonas sp. VKM B-3413]|uniref:hypothetical protein n=1 Tax=Aurantimonas sp. VKM B-3413 TaxID=2779401 RepID=UPI001E325702|nr:hypothetical protein [Aurantimonas sp. VKM B-3413]MCB8839422.1 hypothetical protein [Aurantimonas sp. VKM B-3413]
MGLEFDEMGDEDLRSVHYFVQSGLAQVDAGWRMTSWLRLTLKGRITVKMLAVMGL